MSLQPNTFRWIAFLLWVALIVCSLWFAATTPKAGDGFTRGLNRVLVFVQWQVAAFVVALIAAVRGRRERPTATSARILAYLPLFTQLALGAALVTLVVVSRVLKF